MHRYSFNNNSLKILAK